MEHLRKLSSQIARVFREIRGETDSRNNEGYGSVRKLAVSEVGSYKVCNSFAMESSQPEIGLPGG